MAAMRISTRVREKIKDNNFILGSCDDQSLKIKICFWGYKKSVINGKGFLNMCRKHFGTKMQQSKDAK